MVEIRFTMVRYHAYSSENLQSLEGEIVAINLPSPAALSVRFTERKAAQKLSKQLHSDARKSALFQAVKSAQLMAENSSSTINTLFEAQLKGLPENVTTEFRMEFRTVEGFIRREVRLLDGLNHRYIDLPSRQCPIGEYQSIIKSYQAAFRRLAMEREGLDQLIARINARRTQLGLCSRKVRLNTAVNQLKDAGSLLFGLRHVSDAKDLEDRHDRLYRRQCQLQEKLYREPMDTSGVFTYEQERSRNDIERLNKDVLRLKSSVMHRLQQLGENHAEPTISLRK